MNTSELRAFVAFAEALNFTHAARAVHLSQPALFALVKRLAEAVGVPLYEKRGRALALTAAGERLRAHAGDVVDAERAFLSAVRGEDDNAVCVLACGEGALTHVVGEQVAAFARAHPQRLRVVIADGAAAFASVARGAAHVAVVAGPLAASDELVARSLRRSRVLAVGTRALLESGSEALTLASLAALPLVLPPPGRPLRTAIDDALAEHGHAARVAVEASGWQAALLLARLGCGVALVNDVVTLPKGLVARAVEGLAPVVYRTLARRRRSTLATELLRELHAGA